MAEKLNRFYEKSINYWVHALGSSLAKGASRYYGAKFGIRLPEMRVISNLGTYGKLASCDIVRVSAMDKALVSRMLSALSKRGWVMMVPEDRGARSQRYQLTKSGQKLVERLRPIWRKRELQIQAGLSAQEHLLLRELLEKLFIASEELRDKEALILAAEIDTASVVRRSSSVGSGHGGVAADKPIPPHPVSNPSAGLDRAAKSD